MELMATNLEFRGLTKKTTKSGNTVYNANFEASDSEHIEIYVGQDISKFEKVSKGDTVDLLLEYNPTYKTLRINDLTIELPFQ